MKKSLMALLLLIISSVLFAQAPDAMTFQSVIRTAQGDLATNRNITLRLSILQGNANGTAVYVENQSGKTNANGLITLNLGRGTAVSGAFADIDWSKGPYFLQVAVDVDGGFNFVNQTTTQLLSVPYAFYAQTAETVSGTISYSKLVDVPANIGFSGKYEDLTGAPALATVATTGKYADLQGVPALANVATSGKYEDLTGTPALSTVATSGKYADLQGTPALSVVATSGAYSDLSGTPDLKRVAFTGSYNDLADRPSLSTDGSFSGSYQDLSNRPSFADSVARYGFNGSYNNLSDVPAFASVAFSGNYNDLINKPTAIGGGSGVTDYNDLTNLPSIKDSIQKYASAGTADYQLLLNKPMFADSVAKYETKDYIALKNCPNIRDSVKTYAFSGEYYELNHLPNIVDSIKMYGFSGSWKELKDMPETSQTGALMYYDGGSESWRILPPGNAGDLLMINSNGRPQWVNAAYVAQNISNTEMIEVLVNNYPDAQHRYTITESSGLMSANGKLLVPLYQEVLYEIKPAEGWGVTKVLVNGKDIDSLYYTENNTTFLEFEVDTTGTGYDKFGIDVLLGSVEVTYVIRHDTSATGFKTDTNVVSVGYNCDFKQMLTPDEGYGLYSITVDGVDVTATARNLNMVIVKNITSAKTIVVEYKKDLFSIGDLYKENDEVVGIVYDVEPGGASAKVLNLKQAKFRSMYKWSLVTEEIGATNADGSLNQALVTSKLADYPAFQAAANAGEGWYLPSVEEAKKIYQASEIINPVLRAQGATSTLENAQLWTSTEDTEDYATSYNMYGGYAEGIVKSSSVAVVSIKQVSK